MRQITTNFPDHPAAKRMAQEMAQTVAGLFTVEALEKVPPLKALAVYEENRELIPEAQRDEVARRIADRLVGIDLLDRAAGLLDGLVPRLQGQDKARTVTRIALLRLVDHKPEAALKALDVDIGKDVPPELALQRRQLRARTLAELGRTEEAIASLNGDASREADKLRVAIYWRAQDWGQSAKLLGGLVAAPTPDGTVDDETSRLVLQWATALTLADDQSGLAGLRQKYAVAMEKSPNRDAFRVIAGEAADGDDPRALAAKVAQIGDLQNFMAAYKKLSSVN
jgi:hypothetical protein